MTVSGEKGHGQRQVTVGIKLIFRVGPAAAGSKLPAVLGVV
jgi:hypothetical protein